MRGVQGRQQLQAVGGDSGGWQRAAGVDELGQGEAVEQFRDQVDGVVVLGGRDDVKRRNGIGMPQTRRVAGLPHCALAANLPVSRCHIVGQAQLLDRDLPAHQLVLSQPDGAQAAAPQFVHQLVAVRHHPAIIRWH